MGKLGVAADLGAHRVDNDGQHIDYTPDKYWKKMSKKPKKSRSFPFCRASYARIGKAWYGPIPHADVHFVRRGFSNIVRNRVLSRVN